MEATTRQRTSTEHVGVNLHFVLRFLHLTSTMVFWVAGAVLVAGMMLVQERIRKSVTKRDEADLGTGSSAQDPGPDLPMP